MSNLQAILSFALAAGLLTMTPGLDTALILRTATVKGAREASGVALGTAIGCFIWCILVSAGLGALLMASTLIYHALQIAGACYLLYLGGQMILKSRKGELATSIAPVQNEMLSTNRLSQWFYQGLLNNLLNPKVGVFYVTFLPQFLPKGVNIPVFGMLLGLVHAAEGLLWFLLLIRATRPLSGWLKQPKVTQRLDRLTGGILILFGLKLALEPRRS